jgi:hypothetical protein
MYKMSINEICKICRICKICAEYAKYEHPLRRGCSLGVKKTVKKTIIHAIGFIEFNNKGAVNLPLL